MNTLRTPAKNPMVVAIHVELRKLTNTRSSRWILASMVFLGILMVAVFVSTSITRGEPIDTSMMLAALALPAGIGAPIVSILAVTSDWQHRDVIKFFVLQPRRGLLLIAKYIAVSTFALGIILSVCAVSFAGSLALSAVAGTDVVYGDVVRSLWLLTCVTVVGTIAGAAVASALLSTPLAIVFVLFQSFVFDSLIGLFAGTATPFLQSATLTNVLTEGGNAMAAVSSAAIWIIVPGAIGAWRNRIKDVA
ncbi:hypothetical protein ACIQTZ_13875 [Paenarthrobacter sp. NPDC090520]|uniref:hypothetical protein n=1 Tax=unclassified Paenarthrobacter TaxID=2634190 RepID=UPI00382B4868